MGDLTDRDNLRAAVAEFLATFTFVFVGVGSIGAFQSINGVNGAQIVLIGLAHGLGIMLGVMAVGRISGGHLNPAVTVAAVVTGKMGLIKALMYVVAQAAGGALAALAISSLAFTRGEVGVHAISGDIGTGDGFVLEVILTFFLVFAVFATALDKRSNALLAPFAIGTVIALGHFVAIPLTGASMNPARSFGPALVHGAWDDHWVYWLAPMLGAVIAGVGYVTIFGTDEDRRKAGAISLTEAGLERRPTAGRRSSRR